MGRLDDYGIPSNGRPVLGQYNPSQQKRAINDGGDTFKVAPDFKSNLDNQLAAQQKTEAGYGGSGYYDTQHEAQSALNLTNNYPQQPKQPSLLESLYNRMNAPYQRPDQSQMNFQALDQALKGKLGLIDELKNQTQHNFEQSDVNSQAMGDAFQNQTRTQGAKSFNNIADQQKANLTGDTNAGIAVLQGQKDKDMADRTKMLQALGIQAAGAAVDPSQATLSNGIATLGTKMAGDQTQGDQMRAANLAGNEQLAQSMGMQANMRRQALQMQLLQTLGKANMAAVDAKSQDAAARSNIINGVNDQYYKQYQDQRANDRDLFEKIMHDQTLNNRYNMQYGPNSRSNSQGGISGIANDLMRSQVAPDDASAGMSALNDVLSGGNYLATANGGNGGNIPYDKTQVLAQALTAKLQGKGMDQAKAAAVATQIADGYNRQQTLR